MNGNPEEIGVAADDFFHFFLVDYTLFFFPLEENGDDGARLLDFTGIDRVILIAGILPNPALCFSQVASFDFDTAGDHKSRQEANAKQPDQALGLLFLAGDAGCALAYSGEVFDQVFLAHTNARVADDKF